MMYKLLAASLVFTSFAATAEREFYKGADISLLQTIEDCGGVYKEDDRAKDPLLIFKDNGCNAMRIRLFHTPTGEPPRVNSLDSTKKHNVNYDILGLSYYPWWHSRGLGFKPLEENLQASIERFDKDIMVVETAYPWHSNCDDPTKLVHKKERRPLVSGLPASKEGQRKYLAQIIQVTRAAPEGHCIGLFYWAPEYIPTPRLRPGRGHLSLFDEEGNVLPGMNAFRK